jgi:hypothetical protein
VCQNYTTILGSGSWLPFNANISGYQYVSIFVTCKAPNNGDVGRLYCDTCCSNISAFDDNYAPTTYGRIVGLEYAGTYVSSVSTNFTVGAPNLSFFAESYYGSSTSAELTIVLYCYN